ncbi:CCA1 [Symbiodinium natans]|uniref:CCA1 protein n=1 Tax=Symbiodinium natans TaxID=878477 RepID=A0A812N3X0_9DINO|nr:CCA1 [Symbiodinium natans]
MALLPRQLLSPKEEGMLRLLRSMAQVWVTGGWLRDKVLASLDVNLEARAHCQRIARLCGQSHGDLDLVVAGMTSAEFYGRCARDEAFRSLLRRPPLLVEAKGGRPNTVKLTLSEATVDVTSLADPRPGSGAQSGQEDSLAQDCQHRDVSFNALYLEAGEEEVLDPCHQGLSDLSSGVVRTPHAGCNAAREAKVLKTVFDEIREACLCF